jgi:hypothetical protein
MCVMKKPSKHSTHSSAQHQSMNRDPFYDRSDWFDTGLKQTIAQEDRREAQHAGKTIRRPHKVARTMGS